MRVTEIQLQLITWNLLGWVKRSRAKGCRKVAQGVESGIHRHAHLVRGAKETSWIGAAGVFVVEVDALTVTASLWILTGTDDIFDFVVFFRCELFSVEASGVKRSGRSTPLTSC